MLTAMDSVGVPYDPGRPLTSVCQGVTRGQGARSSLMPIFDLLTCLYVRVTLMARRESGQGLVEYALILVLISIVAILIMTAVGGQITNVFTRASNALNP